MLDYEELRKILYKIVSNCWYSGDINNVLKMVYNNHNFNDCDIDVNYWENMSNLDEYVKNYMNFYERPATEFLKQLHKEFNINHKYFKQLQNGMLVSSDCMFFTCEEENKITDGILEMIKNIEENLEK